MADDGEVGPEYWMRWQVPVCALIIVLPAAAAGVVISRARPDPLRSAQLWTPCWRNLHPLFLLAFRALVFFVMSFILYQMILIDRLFAFDFYTQWTFTLVIIYFGIATIISIRGCWIYSKQHVMGNEKANTFIRRALEDNAATALTPKENDNWTEITLRSYNEQRENQQNAGFWGYMMQIVYQTSAGAAMLTDVVFWGLLVPFMSSDNFRVNLVMGCMHSLNIVFLLLDTALNSLPFPWFRMAYFVLWSSTYVIFQWVLHACGFSWWPYPFLELATPWAPMWYLCMALVHIPCYFLYSLIIKAKYSYFPKIFPEAFTGPH